MYPECMRTVGRMCPPPAEFLSRRPKRTSFAAIKEKKMASSHRMHSGSQQQQPGWSAYQENHEIRRPSMLTAMVVISALGACCALVSALVTFTNGRSLLSSSLGLDPTDALASSVLDDAY